MHISTQLKKCLIAAVIFISATATVSAQRYTIFGGNVTAKTSRVLPTDTSADNTYDAHIKIKNNTAEKLNLVWSIAQNTFTSTNWKYVAFCDPILCHAPIPMVFDFEFDANAESEFKLSVTPTNLAGIDSFTVLVYEKDSQSVQTDTLYFIADARPLGLGKTTSAQPLQLYPNPAKNALYLKWDAASKFVPHHITITTLSGQTVIAQKFSAEGINSQVNIEALTKGTYIVQLTDAKGNIYMARFIKN